MSERPLGLSIAGALSILGCLWGLAFGGVAMTMDGSSSAPDIAYRICGSIVLIGAIFSLVGAVNTLRMKKYSTALWSTAIATLLMVSIFNLISMLIIWGYKKHFSAHNFGSTLDPTTHYAPGSVPMPAPVQIYYDEAENKILSSSVNIYVPNFIDPHISSDIIVEFINNSDRSLENVHVDFTILAKYFDIDAGLKIGTLTSGMKLKKTISIKPKYEEGLFPVKITITSRHARIENDYTIKVGGTEIY